MPFISKYVTNDAKIAMPIDYAALAILYNIIGLAALFARKNEQSSLLVVYMLMLGNLLMFIGYFYILSKARQLEDRKGKDHNKLI